MGVPKFFRWISERYPNISCTVEGDLIPEFDNLYLDMNGIIHNCTHSNDGDGNLGISEQEMFIRIFKYIESLFSIIRPKQIFFMAVDGVAPRAKMNEQRARRFRKVRDLEQLRKKEQQKNHELVIDPHEFDSNCITPGTEFMERLTKSLQYFVHKKISEDNDWKQPKIILSGYEVPGEGEHKIMDYIRYSRTQPDHDHNIRHCIYGLDADLIMLSLVSHEPHFTLLREVVSFSRKKTNNKGTGTSGILGQFILLNLSLMRDYLEHEFDYLKTAQFRDDDIGYDLERAIDDFVLLCMLAGNDFMRNLPGLHIAEGAIALLLGIYNKIRPNLGGYLHDHGELNLERIQKLFGELSILDVQSFQAEMDGSEWFENYQINKNMRTTIDNMENESRSQDIVEQQNEILILLQTFAKSIVREMKPLKYNEMLISPDLSAVNYSFIRRTALSLGLHVQREYDSFGEMMALVSTSKINQEPSASDSDSDVLSTRSNSENELIDETGTSNGSGVRIYDLSSKDIDVIISDAKKKILTLGDRMARANIQAGEDSKAWNYHFEQWKLDFYNKKVKFNYDIKPLIDSKQSELSNGIPVRLPPPSVMNMCKYYIGTLQWVLKYYYRGVQSWRYYYPYHYSPRISDLITGLSQYRIEKFPKDKPYTPLEQLMFVLPPGSAILIPEPLRDLILNPISPIYDLYPKDFEIDLDGKKNDWEAVSLIEFVDANRIQDAMKLVMNKLSEKDIHRNRFGTNLLFKYDESLLQGPPKSFPSVIPSVLPDLDSLVSSATEYEIPEVSDSELVKGRFKDARVGASLLPGFPSLNTLNYKVDLVFGGVVVFQMGSQNESMILTIDRKIETEPKENFNAYVSDMLRQKKVFVEWPYLRQHKIVGISTFEGLYYLSKDRVEFKPFLPTSLQEKWKKVSDRILTNTSTRKGIKAFTDVLVHTLPLKGMLMKPDGSLVCEYGPLNNRHHKTLVDPAVCIDWAYTYPAPLVITEKDAKNSLKKCPYVPDGLVIPEWADDPRVREHSPQKMDEEFPVGQKLFYLETDEYYGLPSVVVGSGNPVVNIQILESVDKPSRDYLAQLGNSVELTNGSSTLQEFIKKNNVGSGHTNIQSGGAKKYGSNTQKDFYLPSYALAKRLGISGSILSRITAQIMVSDPGKKPARFNIGLVLKLEGKGMRAPEYTRRSENGWEYSELAVSLITEYVTKFEKIFYKISELLTRDSNVQMTVSDLLDEDLGIEKSDIEEFKKWVLEANKNLPELVSLESNKFSKEKVEMLEKLMDKCFEQMKKLDLNKTKIVSKIVMTRSGLLKPEDVSYRLSEQKFSLGDRVVLVAESGVPIMCGSCGYIVGINGKTDFGNPFQSKTNSGFKRNQPNKVHSTDSDSIETLEIVWDKPVVSGLDLGGLCSPHRGYKVFPNLVLNLSKPQFTTSAIKSASYDQTKQNTQATGYGGARLGAVPPPSVLMKQGQQHGQYQNKTNQGYQHNNGQYVPRRPNQAYPPNNGQHVPPRANQAYPRIFHEQQPNTGTSGGKYHIDPWTKNANKPIAKPKSTNQNLNVNKSVGAASTVQNLDANKSVVGTASLKQPENAEGNDMMAKLIAMISNNKISDEGQKEPEKTKTEENKRGEGSNRGRGRGRRGWGRPGIGYSQGRGGKSNGNE
ncbi:hypothetical protein BB558_000960 [Smittium angustum]|uniref:5'-3' exoribonuclease 1 n=1 Tax=Smittium angustum TaxID=133377 RepID=A0A2U1JCQ2_SMIAN|nr:hypothetical protein BB558_000960 [Smittium angustum]